MKEGMRVKRVICWVRGHRFPRDPVNSATMLTLNSARVTREQLEEMVRRPSAELLILGEGTRFSVVCGRCGIERVVPPRIGEVV